MSRTSVLAAILSLLNACGVVSESGIPVFQSEPIDASPRVRAGESPGTDQASSGSTYNIFTDPLQRERAPRAGEAPSDELRAWIASLREDGRIGDASAQDEEATGSEAFPEGSIWRRVVDGFAISEGFHTDNFSEELAWYLANPNYLELVSQRSAPFIHAIVEEIDQRKLPMELALLPIVESAFDPHAYSSQSAAGLWQFMSATATGLGLKQDWWYDGRRDPLASTTAALDYLESLYRRFDNDWLLALAAYNAGQGTLAQAIRRNQEAGLGTDFWSLRLPSETRSHVPKLLALAHLFANSAEYEIALTPIDNEPYFAKVDAGTQLDLALAARIAEIDPEELLLLNPGFRRRTTHPEGPHEVLIPVGQVDQFRAALTKLRSPGSLVWQRYTIQPGDSLGRIATEFGTEVAALQQVNGLSGSRIIAGETLLIPTAVESASQEEGARLVSAAVQQYSRTGQETQPARYTIEPGDSLWEIARRFNLSSEDIASWNGIAVNAVLQPGQVLELHIGNSGRGPGSIEYVVQSGDSLDRIARRYRLSVDDIAAWNGISERNLIQPGQQLVLHLAGAPPSR